MYLIVDSTPVRVYAGYLVVLFQESTHTHTYRSHWHVQPGWTLDLFSFFVLILKLYLMLILEILDGASVKKVGDLNYPITFT